MEPTGGWWTRRPRASATVLVAVGIVLALVGATLGVTAVIRLPARGTACDATTAAAQVFPSLVAIGDPGSATRSTGTMIRSNGVILAVEASVPSGSGPVSVTLSDGETVTASVVGTDDASRLAVLQVERRQLPFVLPSPHEAVDAGQPVVALGSPHAAGSAVLGGTVQGVGVTVGLQGEPGGSVAGAFTADLGGTTANLGAPVVTCDYRVVGIVVGRTADGHAAVVPAASAHRVITRLLGLG